MNHFRGLSLGIVQLFSKQVCQFFVWPFCLVLFVGFDILP